MFCAVAIAIPAAAQSNWTAYLQGEERDDALGATRTLEAAWAREPVAFRALYNAVQEHYVELRVGDLDREGYTDALSQLGLPTRAELEAAPGMLDVLRSDDDVGARATVARIVSDSVPTPGTRSFVAAESWLARLADREGFPSQRFLGLVEKITSEVIGRLDSRELASFAEAIPVATDSLDELSTDDWTAQLVRAWSLQVLGALEETRVDLLSRMVTLLEGSSVSDGDVTDAFAGLVDERRALLRLRGAMAIPAGAYALVSAVVFADPSVLGAAPEDAEDLAALLEVVGQTDAALTAHLYRYEPLVAFLVDTTDSLLAALSDLQRYRLAVALERSSYELGRTRVALFRARSSAARLELAGVEIENDPTVEDSFARFLSEGSEYLAGARPWADGERSRSGDNYRWTMLPILSHPYAQYQLATLPELAETRVMVDGFVTQIYEDALRRPELQDADITPLVIGDAVQPFMRVYRVPDRRTATAVYAAFATAAQGVDELPADFQAPYVAGLSVAGYWSHMHGLHVVVGDELGTQELVRAWVDEWFALARVADTTEEELSLTHRALIALRRVLADETDPVVGSSGVVSVDLYEPRLPVARDLLERVATFEVDPRRTALSLAQLYGAPPGDATTDRIARGLDHLLSRLRDVEIPDRRVIHGRSAVGANAGGTAR